MSCVNPRRPPCLISQRDTDALRSHPQFKAVIEEYASANLARYRALGLVERWMVSDMGRASLSGTVSVLDAANRLTPAALATVGAVATGEVSRGRARLYLQRAVANGLIEPTEPGAQLTGDTPLQATPQFHRVMTDILAVALKAAAVLAPESAPALQEIGRRSFVQQVSVRIGSIVTSHPDLFPLTSPVQLFQARNGGTQILEEIIARQRPGRRRLLERCSYSNSALARASYCSRPHVIQLLHDGKARGLLSFDGKILTLEPVLSDAVETYFANLFAVVGVAATRTLSQP